MDEGHEGSHMIRGGETRKVKVTLVDDKFSVRDPELDL